MSPPRLLSVGVAVAAAVAWGGLGAGAVAPPTGSSGVLFFSETGLHAVNSNGRGFRTVFSKQRNQNDLQNGLPHYSTLCTDDTHGIGFWAENSATSTSFFAVRYREGTPSYGTPPSAPLFTVQNKYVVAGCAVDTTTSTVYYTGLDGADKEAAVYAFSYSTPDPGAAAVTPRQITSGLAFDVLPEGGSILFNGAAGEILFVLSIAHSVAVSASATTLFRIKVPPGGFPQQASAASEALNGFFVPQVFAKSSVAGTLALGHAGNTLLLLDTFSPAAQPGLRETRLLQASTATPQDPTLSKDLWTAPSRLPPLPCSLFVRQGALQGGFAVVPGTPDTVIFAGNSQAGGSLATGIYATTLASAGSGATLIYEPTLGGTDPMVGYYGLGPMSLIAADPDPPSEAPPTPLPGTPAPPLPLVPVECAGASDSRVCFQVSENSKGVKECGWNHHTSLCEEETATLCRGKADPKDCAGVVFCHWDEAALLCEDVHDCGVHTASAPCLRATNSLNRRCIWEDAALLCRQDPLGVNGPDTNPEAHTETLVVIVLAVAGGLLLCAISIFCALRCLAGHASAPPGSDEEMRDKQGPHRPMDNPDLQEDLYGNADVHGMQTLIEPADVAALRAQAGPPAWEAAARKVEEGFPTDMNGIQLHPGNIAERERPLSSSQKSSDGVGSDTWGRSMGAAEKVSRMSPTEEMLLDDMLLFGAGGGPPDPSGATGRPRRHRAMTDREAGLRSAIKDLHGKVSRHRASFTTGVPTGTPQSGGGGSPWGPVGASGSPTAVSDQGRRRRHHRHHHDSPQPGGGAAGEPQLASPAGATTPGRLERTPLQVDEQVPRGRPSPTAAAAPRPPGRMGKAKGRGLAASGDGGEGGGGGGGGDDEAERSSGGGHQSNKLRADIDSLVWKEF